MMRLARVPKVIQQIGLLSIDSKGWDPELITGEKLCPPCHSRVLQCFDDDVDKTRQDRTRQIAGRQIRQAKQTGEAGRQSEQANQAGKAGRQKRRVWIQCTCRIAPLSLLITAVL